MDPRSSYIFPAAGIQRSRICGWTLSQLDRDIRELFNQKVRSHQLTHGENLVYMHSHLRRKHGNTYTFEDWERHIGVTRDYGTRFRITSRTHCWTHRPIQAQGKRTWGDDDGDASCDATDGRSIKNSGCHEAAETRTKRVKNTFSNNTSPQPHRG